MKKTINHLPPRKQDELNRLVRFIRKSIKVEMIILFGSHSRGDWVKHAYPEGHVVYEYESDYDILVLFENEEKENMMYSIWQKIEAQIMRDPHIKTPVSIETRSINFMNERLAEGHYYYGDIHKEGTILYNSNKFPLKKGVDLPQKEKRKLMQEDLDYWLSQADIFLRVYNDDFKDNRFESAALHLHQVTESLYAAFLLSHIYYKPKTHNLGKLSEIAGRIRPELDSIFPGNTPQQKNQFELLKKAYVGARYKKDYKVSSDEVQALHKRVKLFKEKVSKLCQEKIKTI